MFEDCKCGHSESSHFCSLDPNGAGTDCRHCACPKFRPVTVAAAPLFAPAPEQLAGQTWMDV